MQVPSPADDSGAFKCIKCGADIKPTAKFCLQCGASQTKAAPATIKCVACGTEIPELAKFCEECGATQTRKTEDTPKDDCSAAAPKWLELSSPVLENSTVSGIDSHFFANPQVSSVTGKQMSEPPDADRVDNEPSTQKTRLVPYGIAVVVIVLACFGWFNTHPISPEGQYELGVKYATGQDVQKDETRAVYWFNKAADQGYAAAQSELGFRYENGSGGLKKDDARGRSWYQKAAEQGNASAQNNLGLMYEQGQGGLAKDDVQAVFWYRKAAEQGLKEAQNNLGSMYENGTGGLAKDDAQALAWYQKAADQGDSNAKVALANVRARQQREQSSGSVQPAPEPPTNKNPRAMTCDTVGWSGGTKPAELTDGRSLEVKIVPIRGSADQLVASLIAVGPFRVENYEPVMPKEVIWQANFVYEKTDWGSRSWTAKNGTIELGSMNFAYENESGYWLIANLPNAMPITVDGKCYDEKDK